LRSSNHHDVIDILSEDEDLTDNTEKQAIFYGLLALVMRLMSMLRQDMTRLGTKKIQDRTKVPERVSKFTRRHGQWRRHIILRSHDACFTAVATPISMPLEDSMEKQ
jgi:hypothetical protein